MTLREACLVSWVRKMIDRLQRDEGARGRKFSLAPNKGWRTSWPGFLCGLYAREISTNLWRCLCEALLRSYFEYGGASARPLRYGTVGIVGMLSYDRIIRRIHRRARRRYVTRYIFGGADSRCWMAMGCSRLERRCEVDLRARKNAARPSIWHAPRKSHVCVTSARKSSVADIVARSTLMNINAMSAARYTLN